MTALDEARTLEPLIFRDDSDRSIGVRGVRSGSHLNWTEHGGMWSDDFDNTTGIKWSRDAEVEGGSVKPRHWKYRTSISIWNPGVDDLTEQQISIELNTSNFNYSRAKTGGADLRFRDGSGKGLHYWIERWNGVGASRVWVNVTTITPGDSAIWMYYGNPDAERRSDGKATFDLFDDFEDEQIGEGITPVGWSVDTAGSYLHGTEKKDGSTCWWQYVATWSQDPPNGGRARIYRNTDTMSKWVFEGRVLTYDAYNNNLYDNWLVASFGTNAATGTFRHHNGQHVCFFRGDNMPPFPWEDDIWYDFSVTYDGATHRLHFDGVHRVSWWNPGVTANRIYLGTGYFGKVYYDVPRLRKLPPAGMTVELGAPEDNPPAFAVSEVIALPEDMGRYTLSVTKTEPAGTQVLVSVVAVDTNRTVEGFVNRSETSINLTGLLKVNVSRIRLKALFLGNRWGVPALDGWKVEWTARYPILLVEVEDVIVTEESPENDVVDLSFHFDDTYTNKQALRYQLAYASEMFSIGFGIHDSFMDVSYLKDNFTGDVLCTVSCTNAYNLTVHSNPFTIRVVNVNDPPAWVSVPPMVELPEDVVTTSNYSLYDHVVDVEGDIIEFAVIEVLGNISASVDGNGSITVIPELDWYGSGTVLVEVREIGPDKLSAISRVMVVVAPLNDAPRFEPENDRIFIDEDGERRLSMMELFKEPEGEEMLFAGSTECEHLGLSMEGAWIRMNPASDWTGECSVTLMAVDPFGEVSRGNITVVVNGSNDPPVAVIEPHPAVMEAEDPDSVLSGRGLDRDGTIIGYRWTRDSGEILDNSSGLALGSAIGTGSGWQTLLFYVKDDEGVWSPPAETRIMLISSGPVVEEFDAEVDGGGGREAVRMHVRISNQGSGVARNVTVQFLLDGEVVDSVTVYHILPGEEVEAETTLDAGPGNHIAAIEVLDDMGEKVEMADGVKLELELQFDDETNHWFLIIAGLSALFFLLLMMFVPFLVRKKRRRNALRALKGSMEKARKAGIGAEDAGLIVIEIERDFRIGSN